MPKAYLDSEPILGKCTALEKLYENVQLFLPLGVSEWTKMLSKDVHNIITKVILYGCTPNFHRICIDVNDTILNFHWAITKTWS